MSLTEHHRTQRSPELMQIIRKSRCVTYSAVRRRYERKKAAKIRKLFSLECGSLYAIIEDNVMRLRQCGDINAVNDWCREAGILAHNEFVLDDAE